MVAKDYVPFKAEADMREWLDSQADKRKISRSELVRRIVRAAMKRKTADDA